MAINFPTPTVNGQTYDYNGVRYVYKKTSTDPNPIEGLWTVLGPGSQGKASAAEIDAGVEQTKYVTPDQLEASKYNDVQASDVAYDDTSADIVGTSVQAALAYLAPSVTYAGDSVIVKWPDGRMEIERKFNYTPTTASTYNGLEVFVTPFVGDLPTCVISPNSNFGTSNGYMMITNVTLTGINYRAVRTGAGTTTSSKASYIAKGRWKL